jgi:hypothetical protein
MARRPRHPTHRGSRPPRGPSPATDFDPASRLRALVTEGIIAAAAGEARDHLDQAAASTQRLGSLTSGMWRALGRELATAAERLDVSLVERLDDIDRRSRSLDVDPSEVLVAGGAASHFDAHRETIDGLVPDQDDAHKLLGKNMLFGCNIVGPTLNDPALGLEDDDETGDEDNEDETLPLTIQVWLYLWPSPLTPAGVSIVPALTDDESEGGDQPLPAHVSLDVPVALLDALVEASTLPAERVEAALSALGLACWTAHLLDEEDEDADDDDLDDLSDEEDQSLGGGDTH